MQRPSAISKKCELRVLPEGFEDRGRGIKQDPISLPAVDLLVAHGFARAPGGSARKTLDGDQTPTVLQLRKKRLEIGLDRAIDENQVEWRFLGRAFPKRGQVGLNLRQAEGGEIGPQCMKQGALRFERHDTSRETGEERRRIASSGPYIEHSVGRCHAGPLDEARENKRRQERAPFSARSGRR